MLIIALLGLIGGGMALWLLADDDDKANGRPTPSPTKSGRAAPTATASSPAAGASTASPEARITLQLLAWSRQQSRWISADLDSSAASYREGDSIPFLMRLDGAVAGKRYEVSVRYQCGTEKGAVFDFLSGPQETDESAVLTAPGPGRQRADSTIPIPDDPSITFDDSSSRPLQLWGATFQRSPEGPLPAGQCSSFKEIRMDVVVRDPAAFLIWTAHVASGQDWGEGRGASSQDTRTSMEVAVSGVGDATLNIAPDAIEP
jgi:hypothetical protein